MVVGILGILKSGGAYLPIDPGYPDERIKYILEDSGTCMLLSQSSLIDKLDFGGTIIDLQDAAAYGETENNLENVNRPSDLAYVIYTSGTTGKPKGVMIEHRNVVRLLFNDRMQFDFNENDVWTMFHSYCFDFSVWEMYGALLYGGKLVVISRLMARDTMEFLGLLKKERVTVLNQTPAAFYQLAAEELMHPDSSLAIRYAIFGGDALKPVMLKDFKAKYPGTKLVNMYGITETTVHVTYKEITTYEIDRNTSSIGGPIPTMTAYVMDSGMRLLPVGAIGELCIGGDGLGRGYLNKPELTAEKFAANPYNPGEKLYRSGDMARRLLNGDLEYMGRIDHQVKIRGHRIELREIENRMLEHTLIRETTVIARDNAEGGKYLCAYFVSDNDITVGELRAYLMESLPDYMVPSYFIRIEKMPVTANGKIDRKALLETAGSIDTGVEYETPRNEAEEAIAGVWREVLGVDRIGINENFFSMGGDSIKAISLINRVNKVLKANFQIKDLYVNQTIKQMFEFIASNEEAVPEENLKIGLTMLDDIKKSIMEDDRQAALLEEECEDFYPLSQIQQGMVFYSELKPEEPIYHDQFVYHAKFENFSIDTFRDSLALLSKRHAILRITFDMERFNRPIQIVRRDMLPEVVLEDISEFKPCEQETHIRDYLKNDLLKKFRFDNDLLWRIRVFKLDSSSYNIVFCCQHAILDGWSVAVFVSELLDAYHLLEEGKRYEPQGTKSSYRDYVAINLSRGISDVSRDYWKNTLEGFNRNKLPFNISNKKINNARGSKIYRGSLGQELLLELSKKAKLWGCSLKEICLCAHIYLLSIITTEKDIVTGVVTHDRPAIEDSEKVLGCFLNTIPIRIKTDCKVSKSGLLKSVRDYIASSKAHELFLADIAGIVGETSMNAGNPVFDTLFNFTDFHVLRDSRAVGSISAAGDSLQMESNEMTNTLFDLEVSKTLDNFGIQIKYSPNYFYDNDIETAFNLYKRILEEYAFDGSDDLEIEAFITEEEKRRIIFDFNNTHVQYPSHKTIHKLFEEQVERTPESTALVFENRKLTYRELNERSNQFAGLLIDRGVACGDNVGLIAHRGFEMIIAMLGILKAGAAYVPIDPEYPRSRQEYIASNSRVSAIAADMDYSPAIGNMVVIDYHAMEKYSRANLNIEKDSGELAYIIYTSGSTGLPKGVMIEHHSAVNLISWVNREFDVGGKDALLFLTSMCFDLSVYDIFGILASGGRVVIAGKGQVQNPEELRRLLKDERITFWDSVPSTMKYVTDMLEDGNTGCLQKDLRLVFLSGDWIPVKLPERIGKYFPNARVISLGGATEGTVWSVYYPVNEVNEFQTSIPYGKPIDNNFFYILDDERNIVPYGVAGELFIGGVGVARGYSNDEEKTNASFVEDRFFNAEGGRMYKTGDLGRLLPDGNIEFLGRKDHQVKIRGYRVELGEIESQLLKHTEIKEAVVVDRTDSSGSKYLCAYLVSDHELTGANLREYLAGELPDYMIPAYFIRLEKLPLTSNGKMDRKALPEPAQDVITGSRYTQPENDMERVLCDIWQEVLGLDRIGTTDDFFEIGGHSLKVTALASRIRKQLGAEVPLREFFRLTKVRDQAGYILKAEMVDFTEIERVEDREYYPLSSAQTRLYILNEFENAGKSYNLPYIARIEGSLDFTRLENAFRGLVDRHEILRTSFELVNGVPVQRIHRHAQVEISRMEASLKKIEGIISDFIAPFDLSKPPLLRIKLVKVGDNSHIMMFDMHHIVSDGTSTGILIKEFMDLYNGKGLPELKLRYVDFSMWQNRLLASPAMKKQEEYWLNKLAGELPVLDMPTDYPRPRVQSFEGGRVRFETGNELCSTLNKIAAETGTTMYMLLMAAYNVLLSRYTTQGDIIVGSPVEGRMHPDLENIVGMFVNTLPLRNFPSYKKTFREFLMEVRENAIEAYENQDYQLEVLIEKLGVERSSSRNTLFDTLFVMQDQDAPQLEIEGLRFIPYEIENIASKFDISMEAVETGGNIMFTLEYCSSLFKKERMNSMADDYISVLRSISVDMDVKLGDIEMGIEVIVSSEATAFAETEFIF
ncbi:MAG: amino acid adenylation domain-containing protein [Bacillota bacterium]|nr:amino acid adenylation domain-containing protein [Bacillota bacterium]